MDESSAKNSAEKKNQLPNKCGINSSRLLKSTAASAARVAETASKKSATPILSRKILSSSRGLNTPDYRGPLSGGNDGQVFFGSVQKSKSSVKTSSFINNDKEVSPHDWDASAIGLKELKIVDSSVSASPTLFMDLDVNQPRDAFKALSGKPRFDKAAGCLEKGPMKALVRPRQDFTTDASSDSSLDRLYDEYLMSELICRSSKKALLETGKKIETEVLSAWIMLEDLRSDIIKKTTLCRKLRNQLDFLQQAQEEETLAKSVLSCTPHLYLPKLAASLEHSQHHLKVVGFKVTPKTSDQLAKLLVDLPNQQGVQHEPNDVLIQFNQVLDDTLNAYKACSESVNQASELTLQAASLSLSHAQVEHSQNASDVSDLFELPPSPTIK